MRRLMRRSSPLHPDMMSPVLTLTCRRSPSCPSIPTAILHRDVAALILLQALNYSAAAAAESICVCVCVRVHLVAPCVCTPFCLYCCAGCCCCSVCVCLCGRGEMKETKGSEQGGYPEVVFHCQSDYLPFQKGKENNSTAGVIFFSPTMN